MTPITKTAAAAGIAAALTTGGSALYKTYYIDADGGGSVYEYVAKYDASYKAGDRIVVRGACYSSCTMALAYPNACLEEKAVMGFHPAYVPYFFGLFHYTIDPQATQEMRRHYPSDALAVIDARKGMENHGGWWRPEITLIKATDFPKRYMCPSAQT